MARHFNGLNPDVAAKPEIDLQAGSPGPMPGCLPGAQLAGSLHPRTGMVSSAGTQLVHGGLAEMIFTEPAVPVGRT
jgi:hypothetical protein